MPHSDTPPVSPSFAMDNDDIYDDEGNEIFELNTDEVEEVGDQEEIAGQLGEGDGDDGDDDDDEEGDISTEEAEPPRDDADIVFQNHTGSVFCCDIDPKLGQFAVTGGEDDRAFVWDINSGSIVLDCKGHSDSVISTEFSHDGTYLAVGDMKGLIQVWKMSTKIVVWDTSSDELLWMKWHPAANVLFAGTETGDVYVYKIPSGEFKVLAGHGSKSNCGVVLADGKHMAVGYSDGLVKVFDIKTANPIHRIQTGHPDNACITCIDASADNNLIITGSLGGDMKMITSRSGKTVGSLCTSMSSEALVAQVSNEESNPLHTIESVVFSKDTSLALAAIGNLNGLLYIWDVSKQIARHTIKLSSGISNIIWDRNLTHIYVGCLDSSVKLYDARSGTIVREFLGHRQDIFDMKLSSDGSKLLTVSDDNTARVFSTMTIDR